MTKLNQMHKTDSVLALLRLEANIMDWSNHDEMSRVALSQLFNKIYMIENMDFFEQLRFYK